jgi:hypothetical protein
MLRLPGRGRSVERGRRSNVGRTGIWGTTQSWSHRLAETLLPYTDVNTGVHVELGVIGTVRGGLSRASRSSQTGEGRVLELFLRASIRGFGWEVHIV